MSITIKFPMGKIVGTAEIAHWIDQLSRHDRLAGSTAQEWLAASLTRHAQGDWGEVDPGDAGLNDESLRDGTRLLSVYPIPIDLADYCEASDDSIWIITEADRSVTTILFPSDY